jgi:hypothetical protein
MGISFPKSEDDFKPGFSRAKAREFLAAKASPALVALESQNVDLKFIFKFWEENL